MTALGISATPDLPRLPAAADQHGRHGDQQGEPRGRDRRRGQGAADDDRVADHLDGQEAVRPAAYPRGHGGHAEDGERRADDGHAGPVDGDCTSSTTPAAVAATSSGAEQVEAGAAPGGGHPAPQQRQHQHAEHGQRDHRAPAEQALDGAAGERAEAGHGGGGAGDLSQGDGLGADRRSGR